MPPSGASRRAGPGPGTRTYAEVAAGTSRDDEVRRIPADPVLKRLIRELYSVLKVSHHLSNVALGSHEDGPHTINKMVATLATMIKPAVPNQTTHLLIEGAAREWGHSVCLVLRQHYEDCLEGLYGGLRGLLTDSWEEAFEVAIRWARRNLPRITRETVNSARTRLTTSWEQDRDPTGILVPDVLPPSSGHQQGPPPTSGPPSGIPFHAPGSLPFTPGDPVPGPASGTVSRGP